jgi:hypothetical protein
MREFPIEVLNEVAGYSNRSIAENIRIDRHEYSKVMNTFQQLGENLTQLRLTMRNVHITFPSASLLERLANLIGGMHKLRLIHICNGNCKPIPSFSEHFLNHEFPHLEDLVLDVFMDDLDKLARFIWRHESLESLSFSLDYKTRKIRLDPLQKLLAGMREKLNLKRFHLGSSKLLVFPSVSKSEGGRPKGWDFRYVVADLVGSFKIIWAAWNVGLYVTNQEQSREIYYR